ncbi:hypothetical protein ABEW34_00780 [Paenibacillus algorifonticola]|uniref:hypothetical protein n=1 Tax=Paenibacillus algorifonticola TaxID=684063 RepID=UPI003D28393B
MRKGRSRHVLYLLAAVAMLVYGVPRLDLGAPWSGTSLFSIVWLVFSLVIVAAQIDALMQGEARRQQMQRIKRAKSRALERKLQQVVARRRARG